MTAPSLQLRLEEARQFLLAQDFTQALCCYDKLTRQFPRQAVIWFEYGSAAARLGQREAATRAWEKVLALEPGNAELILKVGHQYQGARQPEKARACFTRAAGVDPHAMNPRISLALLLEHQHQLGEARGVVEKCLGLDPHDDQARYLAAVLDRRENQLEAAERRLRDLIASEPKHPYVRYACRYELAHVLDRTERFDEAMQVLAQAKKLVLALTDTEVLLRTYDLGAEASRRMALGPPKDTLLKWARAFQVAKRQPTPPLALLGGHPRSGTTLLEQVLGAHPGIAALDEPRAFASVMEPAFRKMGSPTHAHLNVLRRSYARALLDEAGAGANGKLLLDKNPSLTAQLPLALRVFPELRVIVALRDPRDVVVSCYFQNILLNPTNANFLSFERLAKHYADLMDIWLAVRQWEGVAWLETRYEDIVNDLEKEGRRVTGFLGQEWHSEQNYFHQKHRQLYSPTYQDVTRPVHNRSVGRWRFYEKHLAPILPALERYCREFSYTN